MASEPFEFPQGTTAEYRGKEGRVHVLYLRIETLGPPRVTLLGEGVVRTEYKYGPDHAQWLVMFDDGRQEWVPYRDVRDVQQPTVI